MQEVEAAVSLLYHAGEGANEEMTKPGCGWLGQLAMGTPFLFLLHILAKDVLLGSPVTASNVPLAMNSGVSGWP